MPPPPLRSRRGGADRDLPAKPQTVPLALVSCVRRVLALGLQQPPLQARGTPAAKAPRHDLHAGCVILLSSHQCHICIGNCRMLVFLEDVTRGCPRRDGRPGDDCPGWPGAASRETKAELEKPATEEGREQWAPFGGVTVMPPSARSSSADPPSPCPSCAPSPSTDHPQGAPEGQRGACSRPPHYPSAVLKILGDKASTCAPAQGWEP